MWSKPWDQSAFVSGMVFGGVLVGAALAGARKWAGSSKAAAARARRDAVREHIAGHRSIRSFRADREVPLQLLRDLLGLAMRSSTNGNMQTYGAVITQDREKLARLAVIHDNQGIAKCAALVTFVADWTRMVRWCELRGVEDAREAYGNFNAYLTSALDAMVLAQTFALAAEAEGLGICFLGSTIWEPGLLHEELGMPMHSQVVTSIMLGWPAEDPQRRARLDAGSMIHAERFTAMTDAEILAFYEGREVEGWNRYMQLYGARGWKEKCEAHGLQNLAQVYTVLKYSKQDFRVWSERFLESLKAHGFGFGYRLPEPRMRPLPCGTCGLLSHCLDPERLGRI